MLKIIWMETCLWNNLRWVLTTDGPIWRRLIEIFCQHCHIDIGLSHWVKKHWIFSHFVVIMNYKICFRISPFETFVANSISHSATIITRRTIEMEKALRLHFILLMIEKLQRDRTSNVIHLWQIIKYSEKEEKLFQKDEFTFSKDVKKSLQNMKAPCSMLFCDFFKWPIEPR